MWDGFNKRKFPRVQLQCEVTIHPDTDPSPIATLTENLGTGGVCVILDRALDRFETCRLKVEIEPKSPAIKCQGKIVWMVPTKEPKSRKTKYDTGIEFVDLDEDSSNRIRKFIAKQAPNAPAVSKSRTKS